jgi:hypothetical protein
MTGDQRRFAVLLGVLAVLLALVVGRSVVDGGGSGSSAFGPSAVLQSRSAASHHATRSAATKAAAKPADKNTEKAATKTNAGTKAHTASPTTSPGLNNDVAVTDSFEVFATRDPFEPPFDNTPTTTFPSEITSPSTTVPGGGGTETTLPSTGTTTPTVTPTTQPPSFNPGAGAAISVLDVFTNNGGGVQARVKVGSTVYTVGVGDTFATSFKVVSLSGQCGQFLFGDSPFTLCEGEETIK